MLPSLGCLGFVLASLGMGYGSGFPTPDFALLASFAFVTPHVAYPGRSDLWFVPPLFLLDRDEYIPISRLLRPV